MGCLNLPYHQKDEENFFHGLWKKSEGLEKSYKYYPYGLQTSNSWTRENTTQNNYLYNDANELNQTSGWYEMFYRGYDPALGRMLQVDPYAHYYSSYSPYNYAINNPVMMNDPSGGLVMTPVERAQYLDDMYMGGGSGGTNSAMMSAASGGGMGAGNGGGCFFCGGGSSGSAGFNQNGQYGYWISDPTTTTTGNVEDDTFTINGIRDVFVPAESNAVNFLGQTGGCPPGVNCDGWEFSRTDENGSSWYNVPSNDQHIDGLVEVTKDGKVIQHDVYSKNMSEGLQRVFLEAFPIFETEPGQQLGEDVTESILEKILRWPFPLPFYLPPSPPTFDPGPMMLHPKLGPK